MVAFLLLRGTLALNVVILAPVTTWMLVTRPKRSDKVMGPDTQARRILGCMYCSILIISLKALTLDPVEACKLAVPMFYMQIIYKTVSAFTCIHFNQVIVANQFVTAVQLFTLYSLQKEGIQVLF